MGAIEGVAPPGGRTRVCTPFVSKEGLEFFREKMSLL